jgi:hypothetical protein
LQKASGNSEFFNETDGGGLVFKDSAGREVAGICLNGNVPQLYVHRYTNAELSSRVLVEVHEDGLYISTVLSGTNWVKISDTDEVNALIASAIGGIESFGFAGPYDTTGDIPTPDNQHIYLIGAEAPYTEYCYINGAFEVIGSTEIDLTNYYTKSEADTASGEAVEEGIAAHNENTSAHDDIRVAIAGKQDKLTLPLPIASGGTGQTTALAAIQALMPNSSQLYASSYQRISVTFANTNGRIAGTIIIAESASVNSTSVGQCRLDFVISTSQTNSGNNHIMVVYNTLKGTLGNIYFSTYGGPPSIWINYQPYSSSNIGVAYATGCYSSSYSSGAPGALTPVFPTVALTTNSVPSPNYQMTVDSSTPSPTAIDFIPASNVASSLNLMLVGKIVVVQGSITVNQAISADTALLVGNLSDKYPAQNITLPCQYENTIGWITFAASTGQVTIYANPDVSSYSGSTFRFNGVYTVE